MLVQLGNYAFQISKLAYDSLSHNRAWRWDNINVIGDYQYLQYSGRGDDVITLSGVTFPSYNGNEPINEIIEEADRKQPLIMVSALGEVLGRYVIESIQTDETNFHKSGLAHQATFSISLRQHKQ